MGDCCSDFCGFEAAAKPGVAEKRRCRDLLCVLVFLGFWSFMIVIAVIAFKNGDTNRLVYGVDSYGMTCGSNNTWKGMVIDNTQRTNLYYLDPLQLLSSTDDIAFARSICVSTCPSNDGLVFCSKPPCVFNSQFKCPYYALAQYNLFGQLKGVANDSTSYYTALATAPVQPVIGAREKLDDALGLGVWWVQEFMMLNFLVPPSTWVPGTYWQLLSQFPYLGPCYPSFTPTVSYMNRCFPNFPSNLTNNTVSVATPKTPVSPGSVSLFRDWFNESVQAWARQVSNINRGVLVIIAAGLGASAVLCLILVVIIRISVGFFAFLTLTGVNVAFTGATLWCFENAGMLYTAGVGKPALGNLPSDEDPTEADRTNWKWIAVGMAVFTGLLLTLTLLCLCRIWRALDALTIAAKAAGAVPAVFLFPFLPIAIEVAFLLFWITVTAELYSAGDLVATCRDNATAPITFSNLAGFYNASRYYNGSASALGSYECYQNATSWDDRVQWCAANPNCYMSYSWNNFLRLIFIYHTFGLFWTQQFLVGVVCTTTAGAVAFVYWSGGDSSHMPGLPVLVAFRNAFVFNFGSIAFGSFVTVVLWPIRFVLEFLDRHTKNLQAADCLASWCLACVSCCSCCLSYILTYVNRQAYVMIGVKGTGYCAAANRAAELTVKHAKRVAALNSVGDLLLLLAKFFVSGVSTCVAFAICTTSFYTDWVGHPQTFMTSPILVIALVLVVSFVVAGFFLDVYSLAVETMMISLCEDCETNENVPRCAPTLLLRAVGMKPPADLLSPPTSAAAATAAGAPVPAGATHAAPPGAPAAAAPNGAVAVPVAPAGGYAGVPASPPPAAYGAAPAPGALQAAPSQPAPAFVPAAATAPLQPVAQQQQLPYGYGGAAQPPGVLQAPAAPQAAPQLPLQQAYGSAAAVAPPVAATPQYAGVPVAAAQPAVQPVAAAAAAQPQFVGASATPQYGGTAAGVAPPQQQMYSGVGR